MTIFARMSTRQKIYFASDFHLGAYPLEASAEREKKVVSWLESIRHDAAEIYLLGDVFDFWFEYTKAVPKGFVRFLGKIAELKDAGIQITVFKGNHDMWTFGYLEKELGVRVISDELIIERSGKTFYLHHGDGLGPADHTYKFLKKVFRSRVSIWLFARIHPNLGIYLAQVWSKDSRISSGSFEPYLGYEKEWLIQYSDAYQEQHPGQVDYFIFGHRHLAMDLPLNRGARYINLGEWMLHPHFASFDGNELILHPY